MAVSEDFAAVNGTQFSENKLDLWYPYRVTTDRGNNIQRIQIRLWNPYPKQHTYCTTREKREAVKNAPSTAGVIHLDARLWHDV